MKKRKLGFEASASAVRERLNNGTLFFLRDTLVQLDTVLKEKHLPTCLVDEIPSYEYKESKDGQKTQEMPKEDGVDHGADSLRYACWFMLNNKNWGPDALSTSAYPVGSYGRLMDHDKIFSEPIY